MANITVKDVFSVLSKEDGHAIFLAARDGIKATMQIHATLKLTKKQYYTRIQQLVKLGLIEKVDGTYQHTSMGSNLYSGPYYELSELVRRSREFSMIDMLKKNSRFSKEEIDKFASKVNQS
ncbi:MAG: hypothetical protein KGH49_01230 [Candidatus Micrarchaeota archaeon]|nr:hypothetical protein [Candidatus Micrarchaeota archaeon]